MLLPKNSVPFEGLYSSDKGIKANSVDPGQTSNRSCLISVYTVEKVFKTQQTNKSDDVCCDWCFKGLESQSLFGK